ENRLVARPPAGKDVCDVADVAGSRRPTDFHRTKGGHRNASDDCRGRQCAGGDRYRTAAVQSLEDYFVSKCGRWKFLDRANSLWFTFLLAVFGLRYLARFRLRE